MCKGGQRRCALVGIDADMPAEGRLWGTGRDKVMTLWIALVLWAAAVTSEARLFSQPTLALLAWTALFALPPAYSAGRCCSAWQWRAVHMLHPLSHPGYVTAPKNCSSKMTADHRNLVLFPS